MSSYIQTGLTELLVANAIGNSTTLTNTGSSTVQLLNTGNNVVYVTVTASPVAELPITVATVDSSGAFTCATSSIQQGDTVVIGGTTGNANVTLDTGTYYVATTNGLTTQFYLTNAVSGGTTYVPGNIGNGNVSASSYTFARPAGPTPAAPTIPDATGATSPGYPLSPNTPARLTVPGWRSGNILVQAVSPVGGESILITPVTSIGDQTNVY